MPTRPLLRLIDQAASRACSFGFLHDANNGNVAARLIRDAVATWMQMNVPERSIVRGCGSHAKP